MKIFLSWSGEQSKAVGDSLHKHLPSILQYVKTYFSPSDIHKGERWSAELSRELNDCSFGIIILTPENINAHWLLFEAGALSKNINAKVVPLYFGGLSDTDVKGPLALFQGVKLDGAGFASLLHDINEYAGEAKLSGNTLVNLTSALWPRVESDLKNIPASAVGAPPREIKDMVEEVLTISRHLLHQSPSEDSFLWKTQRLRAELAAIRKQVRILAKLSGELSESGGHIDSQDLDRVLLPKRLRILDQRITQLLESEGMEEYMPEADLTNILG